MTPIHRLTLSGLSLSYIAPAIKKTLFSMDKNYRKPFITLILARIHSISEKIKQKATNIEDKLKILLKLLPKTMQKISN